MAEKATITVSVDLFNAILGVLNGRPWAEVHTIMERVLVELQPTAPPPEAPTPQLVKDEP